MNHLHMQDDCELIFEEVVDQRQEDGKIAKQLFYMGIEKNKPNRKEYAQTLLDEISENEWEATSDTEEREECLTLIDWDGEPVAFFRIKKPLNKDFANSEDKR